MSGNGHTARSGTPAAGERVRGLLSLTRPGNAIAAGVFTGIGAFVGGETLASPLPVLAAIAATVLAVGAGNTINDYFDREIDRVNAPERPIPSGRVAPREALVSSVVLFCGATAFALSLPGLALAIAVFNLLVLISYTQVFKGLPGIGNVLVAYLSGSTFLFGAAATDRLGSAVLTLFVLAALATLARELVKDVEDIAGDRQEGLRTVPIVAGERTALVIAAIGLAVAVLASPIPVVQGSLGVSYLLIVVPADAVLCYGLYRAFENPTVGQTYLRTGMFIAAGAFVLGRASVLV